MNFQNKTLLTSITTLLLFGCADSEHPNNPSLGDGKTIVGRFYTEINPVTGSVTTTNVGNLGKGGQVQGIDDNNIVYPDVVAENCSTADWNSTTKTLSVNFRLRNTSATKTFVAPLELDFSGMRPSDVGLISAVNTNDGPSSNPNCGLNGMTRTNCDLDNNGFFDMIYPDEGSPYSYTNDGRWSFSGLLPGGKLMPAGTGANADVSSCSFLQFTLTTSADIGFFYDVIGVEVSGSLATPTINAVTSPTNSSSQTISGACVTGATVYIEGGLSPTSTACAASAYSTSVSLQTNKTNNLSVYQIQGANVSSAATATILHDNVAPQVTNTSPVNSEDQVGRNTTIVITFTEPMKSSSFVNRTTVFVDRSGSGGCGSAVVNPSTMVLSADGTQLIFTPNSTLSAGCPYTVQIYGSGQANTVKDNAGNSLNTTKSFTFTTASSSPDTTRPEVIAMFPTDNAYDIEQSAYFSILFSEPMKTSSFSLTDCNTASGLQNIAIVDETANSVPSVTLTWNGDGSRVYITPSSSLTPGNLYTLMVSSCVKDEAGNQLALHGKLTDGAYSGTQSYAYYDMFVASGLSATAPTLTAVIPKLNWTDVSERISPILIFDKPILSDTVIDANLYMTLQSDTAHVPLLLQQGISGQTIKFSPSSVLQNNVVYETHQSGNITDYSGNYSTPQTATFTTNATADTTAPTVVKISPANGATGVSLYTDINVWFSEPMDATTINNSSIKLLRGATKINSTITLSSDGLMATISPGTVPLTNATVYTVTVNTSSTTDAKDLAGNSATSFSASFTAATDTAPAFSSILPASGATGVPTNAIITINFTKPLDPATIIGYDAGNAIGTAWTIQVAHGSSKDWAIANISPDRKTVFVNVYSSTGSENMIPSTAYSVVLKAASIKNRNGQAIGASNQTYTFTTGTGTSTSSLSVASTSPSPLDGATSVSTSVAPALTFSAPLDQRTVTSETLYLHNGKGSPIAFTTSYSSDGKTLTLTPATTLSATEDYRIILTTAVRDYAGNRLDTTYSACFSTDATACP